MITVFFALIGLVIGLTVNTGGLLLGVTCAIFFGLISWIVIAFRVEEINQSDLVSNENPSETNLQDMQPIDLGRTLALSLFVSVNPSQIELDEAKSYGINTNLYFNEVFFISAFGIVFSMIKEVNSPLFLKALMYGFHEVLSEQSKDDEIKSKLYQTLKSRIDSYMQVVDNFHSDSISSVSLMFGEFIKADTWMRVYKYADAHFSAHAESTKQAISANTFISKNALA